MYWCFRIVELWSWRRLLRVPWTARSNQSILKEISPNYSLEGLMLKLKLQYFGHLMRRADSFETTLMLGKIEGRRRRGQTTEDEMVGWHHRLNGHGIGWILGVFDGQGGLLCCCSWGRKELDMTEWLNWIDWMNHSQGNFCKNCVIANSSWSLQCYFTYTMNVFSQWASLPCCLYFIHNIYYEP